MADSRPTILVVDDDRDERGVIASLLCEAGFAVVAAAHDRAARDAMTRESFLAAVIALPEGDGVEFLRHARRRHPELRALTVIEPATARFAEVDDDTLVARPFDPRQLLGCVFEMVLREDAAAAPHHSHAAEFGIAAARLACLDGRRIAAAAAGAPRLAHDLTRQISEARALHRGHAAAMSD